MKRQVVMIVIIFSIVLELIFQYPYSSVSANEDKDVAVCDFSWHKDIDVEEWVTDDGIKDFIDLRPEDVDIFPSSKKISIGSSFEIEIVQADPDFWEEYDEDVWDESCEDSIDDITFKSKKSYIAKVNSRGIVTGKHKGTTTITTTIYFTSGIKLVRKTMVRVKK